MTATPRHNNVTCNTSLTH